MSSNLPIQFLPEGKLWICGSTAWFTKLLFKLTASQETGPMATCMALESQITSEGFQSGTEKGAILQGIQGKSQPAVQWNEQRREDGNTERPAHLQAADSQAATGNRFTLYGSATGEVNAN